MPNPIFERRLTLAPSTFNREARTVEAVLSAGAEVQRRDASGNYTERLDPAGMTAGDRIPLLEVTTARRSAPFSAGRTTSNRKAARFAPRCTLPTIAR